MDFTGTLPKGFALAKPVVQENYTDEHIEKLERAKRLIITRKRDGWRMFAATDDAGIIRLYTDGGNEIDARLDHIREELASMKLPPHSLLAGECIMDAAGADDLTKVISLLGTKDERKSLAHQARHGKAKYMLFSILFLGGKRVDLPYTEVLCTIRNALAASPNFVHVIPVPVLDMTFAEAKTKAVAEKWEGLVLYETTYVPELRVDGKSPKRTRGSYKWKPILEDDFIVRKVNMRPDGKTVKEFILLQKDPKTKKEFECGKLGGLTNKLRAEYADSSKFPLVVQARFENRFPKSGKIRSGVFMRVRSDKKLKDCIAPASYPEACFAS